MGSAPTAIPEDKRYVIIDGEKPPREVSKEEFMAMERRGNFDSKFPGELATSGFSFEEWHDGWVRIQGIVTSNHESAERVLRGEG